jgi:anti-sigma B factor antagonist
MPAAESGGVRFEASREGSRTVVRIGGEIDLRTSPRLRSELLAVLDDAPAWVIADLSDVGYMDSSGVGTIVEFKRRLEQAGGKLTLAALQPRVSSVFEITQLHRFFHIVGSLDEALKS